MWPKEVPWDGMLTKGVPWLPGQLPWDTCSWGRAFLLLLLLLFIGVAEFWDGHCVHLADFTLPWVDFELAFQVFITITLLERGIKSGSFIFHSKCWETCYESDKRFCLWDSWRALQTAFLIQDLRSRGSGYGILPSGPSVCRM